MSAGLDYAVVNTGNIYTNIDTYQASPSAAGQTTPSGAPWPNGAYNLPGQAYLTPLVPGQLTGAKGQGAPPVVRYVRYNSTANPAVVAGPAPVYWTDETFTTVSGQASEAFISGPASLAGWLCPNTTSISGLTAAILNGNWVFIVVSGFVPAAISAAGAAGGTLVGNGNFTATYVAAGTAVTYPAFARVLVAASSGLSDILVDCDWTY